MEIYPTRSSIVLPEKFALTDAESNASESVETKFNVFKSA